MTRSRPDWEIYERMIARMMSDTLQTDLCGMPNAKVLGAKSGIKRQIEVLIYAQHDTDNTRRIIVDAKRRTRARQTGGWSCPRSSAGATE